MKISVVDAGEDSDTPTPGQQFRNNNEARVESGLETTKRRVYLDMNDRRMEWDVLFESMTARFRYLAARSYRS